MPFTRYANTTNEDCVKVVQEFENAMEWGADIKQAIAIAAHRGFDLTIKQWNSKMGTDAFAAACAILIMRGAVQVSALTVKFHVDAAE